MSTTTTMAAPTLTDYLKKITTAIREMPELAPHATLHIAVKHRIHTLPAFIASPAVTEEDKMTTLKEVAKGMMAVINGKPSGLLGSVAGGQAAQGSQQAAQAEVKAEVKVEQRVQPVQPEPEVPAPKAAPKAAPAKATPAGDTAPDTRNRSNGDPFADRLRELILEVLGPIQADQAESKGMDSAEVKTLLNEHAENFNKLIESVTADLKKEVAAALKDAPPSSPRQVEIKIGDKINVVDGLRHRQFLQIATWVAVDVPLWVWGAAGGGKTTMGEQIAQALGVPFYCVSIDETITVGKLVGFKNLSNGEYVEGLLYRAYKYGGVVVLDEIDTNATTIASLNAMIANDHYTFGNGERVARHEDFRIIAGANTKGTGAVAGYTARVRLDGATLDRFAVIELTYDWNLVECIALGSSSKAVKEWAPCAPASEATCAAWVAWVRGVSSTYGSSVLISPRAALLGVKALRAGIPMAEVADALVFKLMTSDTQSRIISSSPLPTAVAVVL